MSTYKFPVLMLMVVITSYPCFAPPLDMDKLLKEQETRRLKASQHGPYATQEVEALMLAVINEWSLKPQYDVDAVKQFQLDDAIYGFLLWFAEGAVARESNSSIDALANFPASSPGAIIAKAHALGAVPYAVESAIPFLVEQLENPDTKIQVEASETLIHWGREWDRAILRIHDNSNYLVLRRTNDPRAIEACRFGAMNGSLEGRILAATVLEQTYGDSNTIVDVAEYVIQNAPADSTDRSIGRAVYSAIHTLAKRKKFDLVDDMVRLALGSTALVRMESVNFIGYAALEGNVAAYDGLRAISQTHFDWQLRAVARDMLQKIQQESK